MGARAGFIVAVALSLAACAARHAVAPDPPPPAAGAVEAAPPAATVRTVEFGTEIRPLLQEKCSPCHFAGGQMYDRLPFDRPETIRVLGTALFTRLTDEGDQATIRAFLDSH